ncbi:uncharacterized protein EI97DRAFT_234515 [Westerdykella ornata]|uniref:Uncharacterized protein n=1 Tax=Westerdykella ornata TaxID=318751 RepID=A0A6A6J6D0_WESOR|nr:uncharacterized protein EI97DRAFT_234515 [Westerdykella ornata]KAF2272131.1 hypothetical protein EI97DRAFT_234515 [Westerdykella ornata]
MGSKARKIQNKNINKFKRRKHYNVRDARGRGWKRDTPDDCPRDASTDVLSDADSISTQLKQKAAQCLQWLGNSWRHMDIRTLFVLPRPISLRTLWRYIWRRPILGAWHRRKIVAFFRALWTVPLRDKINVGMFLGFLLGGMFALKRVFVRALLGDPLALGMVPMELGRGG